MTDDYTELAKHFWKAWKTPDKVRKVLRQGLLKKNSGEWITMCTINAKIDDGIREVSARFDSGAVIRVSYDKDGCPYMYVLVGTGNDRVVNTIFLFLCEVLSAVPADVPFPYRLSVITGVYPDAVIFGISSLKRTGEIGVTTTANALYYIEKGSELILPGVY